MIPISVFLVMNQKQALVPRRLSLIPIIWKEYLRMRKKSATCNNNLPEAVNKKSPQQINRDKPFAAWGGFMEELGLICRAAITRLRAAPSRTGGAGILYCSAAADKRPT
ncbi:hypothetical protein CDAR_370751 [Caerostris darwini]|uniref:Uncharacterized protein n=1 Tax=Caerostris darwini TaxID=1538125 RepID=A0AAV4VFV3_9ARAC|nr:hypothetical protein CDAR_370751 [Caerostris darwini]